MEIFHILCAFAANQNSVQVSHSAVAFTGTWFRSCITRSCASFCARQYLSHGQLCDHKKRLNSPLDNRPTLPTQQQQHQQQPRQHQQDQTATSNHNQLRLTHHACPVVRRRRPCPFTLPCPSHGTQRPFQAPVRKRPRDSRQPLDSRRHHVRNIPAQTYSVHVITDNLT